MTDPILTKTHAGVSKDWLRKEVEDIKAMLDQLILTQTDDQYIGALKYCEERIRALQKLAGQY